MRKAEQLVWDAMKRNAPADFWLQRIENVMVDGMPDVHSTHKHIPADCWVELKAVVLPARASTRVLGNEGLRQSQINWHILCYQRGGRSFILIRDDRNTLYLIAGMHAQGLNDEPLAMLQEKSLASNWRDVFNILANGYL